MQVNSFLDSFLPSTVGGRKETPSLRPDSYVLEIFSARAGFTVSCVCREPSPSTLVFLHCARRRWIFC
jgi:hypothetical protein